MRKVPSSVNLIFSLFALFAFFLTVLPGITFFGLIVHESFHAFVCSIFGVPYSFSLTHVDFNSSPNPGVNMLIYLSGGIGEAFFSLLFFLLFTEIEKKVITKRVRSKEGQHALFGMLFGFEIVFLAMGFHGFINGIWEGFFTQSYSLSYDSSIIWNSIFVGSLVVAFFVNFVRIRSRSRIGI